LGRIGVVRILRYASWSIGCVSHANRILTRIEYVSDTGYVGNGPNLGNLAHNNGRAQKHGGGGGGGVEERRQCQCSNAREREREEEEEEEEEEEPCVTIRSQSARERTMNRYLLECFFLRSRVEYFLYELFDQLSTILIQ
jgi:hypothetical protein